MIFYIMLPGESAEDCFKDTNTLGEDNGFGVFWAGSGLKALMNMVDKRPDMLPHVTIKDAGNKSHTIEEFLTRIAKLKVRIPE